MKYNNINDILAFIPVTSGAHIVQTYATIMCDTDHSIASNKLNMNSKIIQTLQKNPKMDIGVIAKMMGISSIEVSHAQHDHLKLFLKRDSHKWSNIQKFC